jgi:hypothetical protein
MTTFTSSIDPLKLSHAIRSQAPEATTPLIPKLLLDWMEKLWPERSADLNDNHDLVMWRGGQRSVVRKLLDEYRRQNDNILTR